MAGTDTSLLAVVRAGAEEDDGSRDQALDGALAAFLDFGVRRTTMGEIARRSGLSPATLYRWYGSKDDLVMAVGLRETRRFLDALEASIDRAAPPEEQLVEVTVLVARHVRDQPLLRRLIETEPEAILPRLTTDAGPIIRAGTDYLVDHIERLMDEGSVPRFDPRPLAEVLARLTHSFLLTPSPAPVDDDQLRDSARESIRWLLRLTPRRAP